MRLLWITWKDHLHPETGGAEVVCRELTTRLVAEGHHVTILTARYPGSKAHETDMNGIEFVRVGKNRYTHPLAAGLYYMRHYRNKFDIVIEEIQGCAPYFAVFFGKKSRRFLFYHQLARKNWLYEVPAPLSYIGYYLLAPLATHLIALSKAPVITVSESTRAALAPYGFNPARTSIITLGLPFEPLESLSNVVKYSRPTVLSFGAMRAMKRTLDQVKAFELAKEKLPQLQMKIGGSAGSEYGQEVLRYIEKSPYKDDIEYLGKVSVKDKAKLMQQSHLILVTSVEEGWGLIVSEANGQGTPAVVYAVEGLRDSVKNNETGLTTEQTPAALAEAAVSLLQDKKLYTKFQHAAFAYSRTLTFSHSYKDFTQIVGAA